MSIWQMRENLNIRCALVIGAPLNSDASAVCCVNVVEIKPN